MNRKTTRRDFLTLGLGLGALSSLLPGLLKAEGRRGGAKKAEAPLTECKVDDPNMRNLGYAANHSQVKDKNQMVSRAGVEFNAQFCNNCMFYQGKTTDKLAKCQLAPAASCGVSSKGWCPSWQKKA
ncbi:MAG: high-potential iron-sulfur protein [Bdellovibrio sp.]